MKRTGGLSPFVACDHEMFRWFSTMPPTVFVLLFLKGRCHDSRASHSCLLAAVDRC
ncbi:MAG: hypothetical protein KatS3mg105_3202 [Gemmatales bacterium]|nr:MAG: hypothetical protein KatS3mg105_3202 [Gemmatales bacterium]